MSLLGVICHIPFFYVVWIFKRSIFFLSQQNRQVMALKNKSNMCTLLNFFNFLKNKEKIQIMHKLITQKEPPVNILEYFLSSLWIQVLYCGDNLTNIFWRLAIRKAILQGSKDTTVRREWYTHLLQCHPLLNLHLWFWSKWRIPFIGYIK